jgi:hypothetical protein
MSPISACVAAIKWSSAKRAQSNWKIWITMSNAGFWMLMQTLFDAIKRELFKYSIEHD